MDFETFVKSLAPLLRDEGFKKTGTTWRKSQGESVAVINLQKSQWCASHFYINLGVYIYTLGNLKSPPVNKCHVQFRLAKDPPCKVALNAIAWLSERATLDNAAKLSESDSKTGLVVKELRHTNAI